ncbi:nucleoside-diphosphate sugar epimerase [Bacillus manliponensis]|uniref:Nucleoside-diphosphate sugar epimerase n=2 Tax=Bacillus manliponensis TaxID=574376 RepID=A0A073K183_9BACI|nr:nucleoside-diphosphate sugar epimerase [Bacillus manliponensis]KEK20306.1 nucleoside-diphosphate sugar epimerase [Bacillus manliponensis]
MYYKQPSILHKLIEPTIVFLALAMSSISFNLFTPIYEYFILLFILLFFANHYGIKISLFVFLEIVIYVLLVGTYKGENILLYFFSLEYWLSGLFLLIICIYVGSMSTSHKEKYRNISKKNTKLQDDNKHLQQTVKQLNEVRVALRSRAIESDNHLSKMFHMFKSLNNTHPEIVLDEGMNILKTYFGAKKIAIYYVDDNKQSLRIKLRLETGEQSFPQSILVNTTSQVIKNALAYNKPFFRTNNDFDYAPLLVGPISVQKQIRYLVVLDEIEFSKLTSDQFELFIWYLRWMGDTLQYASNAWLEEKHTRTFPNTNLYRATEFKHLLHIEQKRFKTLAHPYSYFEIQLCNPPLLKLNAILTANLREIDIFGYDLEEQKLMVLLPGTEEQFLPRVKERVIKAVASEMKVPK